MKQFKFRFYTEIIRNCETCPFSRISDFYTAKHGQRIWVCDMRAGLMTNEQAKQIKQDCPLKDYRP